MTRVVQLRCDAYVFNNAMSGMGRLAQWRRRVAHGARTVMNRCMLGTNGVSKQQMAHQA